MIFVITSATVGQRGVSSQQASAHQAYLDDLTRRGVLLLGGAYDDATGSLLIIDAADLEEAVALARENPLVVAGIDRYQVRGWNELYGRLSSHPGTTMLRSDNSAVGVVGSAVERMPDSGPLIVPPSEESYSIVDALDDPAHAEVLTRCFAPKQIAADDPWRQTYLSQARERGLGKLLLVHEGSAVGQVEFSTTGPATLALPISGPNITVVHCLWVVDAHTGLDSGRRLLAACAEARPGSSGLATIAYNSPLSWMPRSYFERQGFVVIDQLETGRFFGDTPIVACLMWRPLRDDAPRPTWDRDALRAGVDFCPAYPWMFGRRLYWGRDFPYRAVLVREGLRRPELLEQLPVLARHKAGAWSLVKVGIPAADLSHAVRLIQGALIEEPTYYAYIYARDSDELIIVYPYRDYHVTRDQNTWAEALRYGLDKGIPREELVFTPFLFPDEPE